MGLGAKIIIEKTGVAYHTLKDWGLVIGNTNYIGEPVQETNYVTVPGASIELDLSESLTGAAVYKYRPINIQLGGLRAKNNWDAVISSIRNKVEGKIVHVIFDNDPGYYWRGRAGIVNFDRVQRLGRFELKIPMADPFKYDVFSSGDPWEWDSFDFENGAIRYLGPMDINGNTIVVPKGNMEVVPVFQIDSITSDTMSATIGDNTYTLQIGENRFPQIKVAGDKEVTITFAGVGRGTVWYRGGSL